VEEQPLKVYWRPGCSSCVRVKEFLSKLGVEYESINVSARPQAMEELRALGVRTVPVVARGAEYVFAQELADVSQFIGRKVDFERLPAPTLLEKWLKVLAAGERCIAQFPAARLDERATEGRERSIRELAYHVYQIPQAFLQAVLEGNPDLAGTYNEAVPADVRTADDIRAYAARMTNDLAEWWRSCADKSCAGKLQTYYGEQPLHHVLERCTWHSAQHVRQLLAVLERLGIAPEKPLTARDYAGLPMPEGLWE
jgi:glutaredoxin/uncharacterized damage-inducible protein DinB